MVLPSDAKARRSVPFDELYDISDQEEVKVRNLKRTLKERGKANTTKKSHNHVKRKQRLQADLSPSSLEAPTERMEQQRSTNKNSKLSKPSLDLTHDTSPTPGSRWRGRKTSNMALSSEEPNTPHHGNGEDYFDFSADDIDASTPLNNLKANEEITSNSSAARKRKRSELQIPQSSPIVSSTVLLSASNPSEIIPSSNRFESGDGYERNSKDEGAGEEPVNDRASPSDTLSSILAPPKSSSSLGSSPLIPRNLRSSRARTPRIENDYHSNLSSPPSLTHSPDLPAEMDLSSELLASLPSNFSTAQLQALLPRRRKRRVRDVGFSMESDNEVDISSLASDDDELLYFPTHKRDQNQRQVSTAPKGTFSVRKNVNTIGKKKAALLKKCATLKRKSYEKKKEIPLEENSEEDPESHTNDENASENSQELEKRIGKELKMATRKFQEIDKWQLDFEEVTVSGSSSPNDAR